MGILAILNADLPSLDLEAMVHTYLERVVEDSVPVWRCRECGKTSSKLGNIRDHVESNHIDGLQLNCQFCLKTFKSSASLRMHKSRYHKD